jgi:transposase InsO family protein
VDIKKLARIERVGYRITGNRQRDHTRGAGYEYVHVAIDDASRIAFARIMPDEGQHSAVAFLQAALAYFGSLGIKTKSLMSDNGVCYRSKLMARTCHELRLRHLFTRPYTPQTNGKAERFIQSALREWAYGIPYNSSAERTTMLHRWIHHYNWHRPHQGIGGLAPVSRLGRNGNNVLALHS